MSHLTPPIDVIIYLFEVSTRKKYDLLKQLGAKRSQQEVVKRDLENEMFSKKILENIFTEW